MQEDNLTPWEDLILQAQLWESRTIERQALLIADLQQEISDLKAINRILLGKVSENDDPRKTVTKTFI